MKKKSVRGWFNRISIAKKLYFTMGIMALLIALELSTLNFAVNTLSSVRAYVAGEGLWSKAQKDAIFHLEKFGRTKDINEYYEFLSFMDVPIGDHKARVELNKTNPDFEVARKGFLQGRNDPEDVDRLITLFRRFHDVDYIRRAIEIWAEADSVSSELIDIGETLHNDILVVDAPQSSIERTLERITPVNFKLTILEDEFSKTLGQGSRWVERLIMRVLLITVLIVEATGMLLTISVSRNIQKGLHVLTSASEKIAGGNLDTTVAKTSDDEIGTLADAFNNMTRQLKVNVEEKVRSRRLLKESEESMLLLLDNIRDYSIFMINLAGEISTWNEAAERITGYRITEIIGKSYHIFYTPEQVDAGEPQYNLAQAKIKGSYQTEGLRLRKDGSMFWADIVYTCLYDDKHELRGYAKIMRDMTESKKVQNNLIRSRTLLANAQQLAHIGSWEWDPKSNRLEWSEEMYRIYGIPASQENITTEIVDSMVHPGDLDNYRKLVRDPRRTHRYFDFQYRIIRPDNSVRYIHSRGEVITNRENSTIRYIGSDQDITERIHEEELEKLATAATKSNNSVVITDTSGKIEWVNEGFTKLTGYTLDEVKNTHGEVLRKGEPTGLSVNSEYFKEMLAEKKPVMYESRNYTKNGDEYWVITTLSPILGRDGKVERILGIDSNITERKKAEHDLVLANRIAEHSLNKGHKALQDLITAKRELEESMRVKEQFLAKMSHEIRTPMNAIIGMSELMLESGLTEEQKEFLVAIRLSSSNLLNIINDILDFSKLESGKVSIEMIPFHLKEVIDGVILMLNFSAQRKNIVLSSRYENGTPTAVIGDPVRLRQILLNLVSNAIKFTDDGNVTIRTSVEKDGEQKLMLKFTVEDTGIGIPPDRIESIFESFNQASNETSRKYGGTGLGLTIVKQLAELMGGSVKAESEINKGSVFTVLIPFEKSDGRSLTIQQERCEDEGEFPPGVKILLAEDNEMNQLLAKKIFENWHVHCDIASNGRIAVERLRESIYDLILMDIQMPEMDGYEATKYIRHSLDAPKNAIPIIAMTAHAIVGEQEKCIVNGMNDYISKPFSRQLLRRKIIDMLDPLQKQELSERSDNTLVTNTTPPINPKKIDLAYLQELSEGNTEFVIRMIKVYLKQMPVMMNDLSRGTAEKQWHEVQLTAHKMKSSLDFVGLTATKEKLSRIEKLCTTQTDVTAIPAMVAEVLAVCEMSIRELNEELRTLDT